MGLPVFADTHCHLDFPRFDADRDEVLRRAAAAGVGRMLVPGTDVASSSRAVALAAAHEKLFAAVGVHPHGTKGFGEGEMLALRELAGSPGVVAVGEIGLDYYRDLAPRADQMRAFRAQLALAAELSLPVIVHNREATGDVLGVLAEWAQDLAGGALSGRAGVLHSFSAGVAEAEKAVQMGFYVGITGPITYSNGEGMRAVAAAAPLERLLVETDSPYLAPQPHRGRRNEPAHVCAVARKIAEVRALPLPVLARATTASAGRLFGWEHRG